MREVEMTTQHLINDGFDIGTGRDPYKNFVYTSFQELATYVSHNRVAQLAKSYGDNKLSKICKMIAGDEMRHHHAYSEFVNRIFQVDPSEMMLAFQYMMKQKIVMPAQFLRESGEKISSAFFIKNLIDSYFIELIESNAKPNKIALELSDSKVLLWAEIANNDEPTEDALIMSAAKVNHKFSRYGFHISSTIVDEEDQLNIPKHYKEVSFQNS
jgi:hypothetical protein